MEFQIWWIWMIFAALFFIAEIFTMGFFILWFGIGAAVAGVFGILGFNAGWQWGSFVVVSGVLFASTRRLAERLTKKQPPGIGADRFIGKVGVVLESVDNVNNTGQVRIDKDKWRADSDSDEVIPVGKRVKVVGLDGTHLVVQILKEGD
ncbi:NfeD family protein [candidate division TA06 bacterium]|uniref:NfeD family protein n=1 Tax=candidate division TA06 bacterium TaxID=2250710 RepID=A0A523XQG9_UNCT6|nr:MAG: NfeD family protein [candidate division TA06 bacterium]